MPKLKRIATTMLVVTFALSLSLGGCTKYASKDDLAKLEEQRSAATSAERELEQVRGERRQVEQERDAKKAELANVQAQLDEVKGK